MMFDLSKISNKNKNSNKPCSNLGYSLKFKCISTTKSPNHRLIWRGNTSRRIKTLPRILLVYSSEQIPFEAHNFIQYL